MPEALQILLVEDDRDDATLLERTLRRDGIEFRLERVETAEAMNAALEAGRWDIVLSDFTMPRFSGLAALELLREKSIDVPFIFVSGTLGEDLAVKAMKLGASDYLLKGNLARLAPAIQREVRERNGREARRRSEQELRRSEERYGALFGAAPFPMWVFERESHAILAVNDAAVRHYGFSREEFAALTIRDLCVNDGGISSATAAYLADSDVVGPTRHRKKDGTIIHVEVKAHDLDFDGKRARLVAIHDVTERIRAEEALQEKEEQLRQSQKMEAVGTLAGGIAHDTNNMLSVVLSYADLIAADLAPGDPHLDDLREISNAGTRAAEMTRQLLLFSRQQVLERQVIDLNVLLAGLQKLFARILGEDIAVECRPSDAAARIHANPGHVEQVLMNLVVNARDAMPEGGKLTIAIANVSFEGTPAGSALPAGPGAYVRISVTDTGIGMDRATQARVFEPFFTTKTCGKGTGLGLSTVFGIMKQSDGTVRVSSETGKGATFDVYFPRVEAAVERRTLAPEPSTVRGTETIVVVEDEEPVRAVVCSILRRHGYDVHEAASPEYGLILCGKLTHARLLVSDVVMPGMSGPELARLVVRSRPDIRVLLMSGYTGDSLDRYALNSEIAFLPKPITPESLTRKVREILDRTALAEAGGAAK
jgi:two-component system cell cycle sensor histidine kinase/response regulator CckA